jgi:phosphoribosylanthranilate isomerase
MRTRVKICGITSQPDAAAACSAGADAIGLVFYSRSPRHVSIELASAIALAVPPFVSRVALFKDASTEEVEAVLACVEIDLLQFHGSEDPAYCRSFGRPYIKALGLKGVADIAAAIADGERDYAEARALLLDGHAPGEAGGSGESLDWSSLARTDKPLILAGGLDPDNVRRAIELARPYAVDVSSGVEASPGIKDAAKINAFLREVAAAR